MESRKIRGLSAPCKSTWLVIFYASFINIARIEEKKLGDAVSELALRLVRVPRITREFLAMLFENREKESKATTFKDDCPFIIRDIASRLYQADDFKEELKLLGHRRLIWVHESDHEDTISEISLRLSSLDDLALTFTDFIEHNALGYRNVIGRLDFSAF